MYYKESCTGRSSKLPLPRSQGTTKKIPSSIITTRSSSTNVGESEFVYVDCLFHNTNYSDFENIRYEASRNTPILNERKNYKLGVISVSGHIVVPLLTDGVLLLSTTWTTPGNVSGTTYSSDVFPTIYSAEEYVRFFNTIISQLWAATKIDYDAAGGDWDNDPGIPLLESGLTFDTQTQTFTLYGDPILSTANAYPGQKKVQLWLGNVAAGQLSGMDLDFTNNSNPGYTLVNFYPGFEDNNIITLNGNDYIANTQDSPTIGMFNQTNSLVLVSNSLGTRRVDISRSFDTVVNSTDYTVDIIDSFPISLNGGLNHFITFANPNINFNDILANGPLDRLSFAIYTLQSDGTILPLKAPPRGTVVVRLVFARTLFTSN